MSDTAQHVDPDWPWEPYVDERLRDPEFRARVRAGLTADMDEPPEEAA